MPRPTCIRVNNSDEVILTSSQFARSKHYRSLQANLTHLRCTILICARTSRLSRNRAVCAACDGSSSSWLDSNLTRLVMPCCSGE